MEQEAGKKTAPRMKRESKMSLAGTQGTGGLAQRSIFSSCATPASCGDLHGGNVTPDLAHRGWSIVVGPRAPGSTAATALPASKHVQGYLVRHGPRQVTQHVQRELASPTGFSNTLSSQLFASSQRSSRWWQGSSGPLHTLFKRCQRAAARAAARAPVNFCFSNEAFIMSHCCTAKAEYENSSKAPIRRGQENGRAGEVLYLISPSACVKSGYDVVYIVLGAELMTLA